MEYLDKVSLAQTIDNVSEALLFNLEIGEKEKYALADFIAGRHGQPRSYANTFAPTDFDLQKDLILFTGEKVTSAVGKCHMIGEEASRILRKLNIETETVKMSLIQADEGLHRRISENLEYSRYPYGMYCCKMCSCALWINLASGGLYNDTELLLAGLGYLKQHRENNGKWKGFPYYYVLYVLNEIETDLASDELKHTAGFLERKLRKKKPDSTKYELRRNYICEKTLEKVNSN